MKKQLLNANFINLLSEINYRNSKGQKVVWHNNPLSQSELDYLSKNMKVKVHQLNGGLINKISW